MERLGVHFGPYGIPITIQQTDACKENEPSISILSYDTSQQAAIVVN